MLVTPIRDGMNLVAKEYVATRNDERGVLVLSEYAGAFAELVEAVATNPYDIDSAAEAYYTAQEGWRLDFQLLLGYLRRAVLGRRLGLPDGDG